ncbi:hypothetical protein S245_063259, partial [Arachis hypogaea]
KSWRFDPEIRVECIGRRWINYCYYGGSKCAMARDVASSTTTNVSSPSQKTITELHERIRSLTQSLEDQGR